MVKKAFMKTLEALLAIIITSVFMLSIVPEMVQKGQDSPGERVLEGLEQNDGFRNLVTASSGCFNATHNETDSFISGYLPETYDYKLCIGASTVDLPDTNVFAEALFFTGNTTQYDPKTVKLYYWYRS